MSRGGGMKVAVLKGGMKVEEDKELSREMRGKNEAAAPGGGAGGREGKST